MQASVNSTGSAYTEIKAYVINKTAWPARVTSNLSFRYYVTLEPGGPASALTVTSAYNQCSAPGAPTQYSGSVWFVTVSCVGTRIAPSGQSDFRKEVQFRIASSGAWDPANDWSYQGVATTPGATPVTVPNVVLLDGTRTVWGAEPGTGPSPSGSPTASPTASPSGPAGVLEAQYKNNEPAATSQQIRPGLALRNTGSTPVALNRVTLRYWFTSEGSTATYSTFCDYAQAGCATVTERVVRLSTGRPGANAYLEVGFTGGTLPAGASTGDLQARFSKTDWSAFTQTDDYSYGTGSTNAAAPKVTAYVDGSRVWGIEP